VVGGLAEISLKDAGDITSKKFLEKCRNVGSKEIETSIGKAAAFYSKGGPRVFAEGIANAINKGLRNQLVDVSKLTSAQREMRD
jgi:hypothetical protein